MNRTAAPGIHPGAERMRFMFEHVLRPALSELRVEGVNTFTTVVARLATNGPQKSAYFASERAVAFSAFGSMRMLENGIDLLVRDRRFGDEIEKLSDAMTGWS